MHKHLGSVAVQLGLLLLLPSPLETARFDTDHLVVLGNRQAEVPPLVVHGGQEGGLPIRFRQRLDLAEHGAWLLRVAVLFTRIKHHDLCLVLLKGQLDLGASGGFLDHAQG